MSDIAENGEPTIDDSTPTQEVSEVPENVPKPVIQLKFNSVGLPIGPGARQAMNKLGSLIRSQIPIRYTNWRLVSTERKDLVWADLKKEYNFTDSQKGFIMRKGGATWKKFKASLRRRKSNFGESGHWTLKVIGGR
ncbi:hypothetical protein ACHQM5_008488 [Ranunculus cassubicifolius]